MKKHPLSIDLVDARLIDKKYKSKFINELRVKYNVASKMKSNFSTLPTEAQTVIASLAFQYGELSINTPKFWKAAVAKDWYQCVKELKNFGDKYPTRRKKEAVYLERVINEK